MTTERADDGWGLWIPGPVWVRPELREVLARPAEGHRTRGIEELIASFDGPLEALLGAGSSSHEVGVHSATASALMEMGLRAVGPRVLAVVNGAFSRRFADVAAALGKECVVVESELGTGPDLARAQELLSSGEPFDAVTVCASETSTGAYASAALIGEALRDRRGARLLVDAVTLLGGGPLDVAENGIDFAFAGTQKALALPPGLGIYAASRSLLDAAGEGASGSWFLDLARIHAAHRARKPPMTPTVPLLRALGVQLAAIQGGALEDGLAGGHGGGDRPPVERRFARHREMSRRTQDCAARFGVAPFGAAPGSPTVTAFDLSAAGYDPAEVLARAAADGVALAKGYGVLADRCLRVGHMGDRSLDDLDRLLDVFAGALQSSPRTRP